MKRSELLVWAAAAAVALGASALQATRSDLGVQVSASTGIPDRDKTGTTAVRENANSSQPLVLPRFASRESLRAEGMGLLRLTFRNPYGCRYLGPNSSQFNNLHIAGC